MSTNERSTRVRWGIRLIVALSVAAVGVAAAGTAAAALAAGAVTSITGYDGRHADQVPQGAKVVNAPKPTKTTAAPTPTADASAIPKFDQWGVRIYGKDDNAAEIDYAGLTSGELANAKIWVKQQFIVSSCMADQGYPYGFKLPWERSPADPRADPWLAADPTSPQWIALWGHNTGPGYDWTNAGCEGYAVHVTGMDGAH